MTRSLNIRFLDQTVILDRAGRVAYVDQTVTSADALRRALDRVLARSE